MQRLSFFFKLHAGYNLLWGLIVIISPNLYFEIIGMESPMYLSLWQVVGMFVVVYAPAYWWIAKDPRREFRLVVVAALGTLFGPVGYIFSLIQGSLPVQFGWTLITNDIIWFPLFIRYFHIFIKDGGLIDLKNSF